MCGVWEESKGPGRWVSKGTYNGEGIKAIADAMRVSHSLTECNVRGNALDVESAKLLAKVATEKRVMLFGITHDQRVADFQGKYLKPPDAVLIANDISVSRSLSQVLALSSALTHCLFLNLAASHHVADQPEFKQVVRSLGRK